MFGSQKIILCPAKLCIDINVRWTPFLSQQYLSAPRCVIAEMFTDGTSPFDLSQLLAYRNGEYSPWKFLEKIDDQNVRV